MRGFLAIAIIFILAVGVSTYLTTDDTRLLPIINPVDINPDMVDPSIQNKGMHHQISEFYLQNQEGTWVTNDILKGKITVVNYFFVRCGGICPAMNKQMMKVNQHFKSSKKVMLLSHTVWPEVDSISVLKDYAERYNADSDTWQFLTGDKQHLYELARKSYLICPDKDDPNYDHGSENDFIHTENVILVDAKGQIRGFYNGTFDKEMEQLILDIQILIDEQE